MTIIEYMKASRKQTVGVLTDSTASIPEHLVASLRIEIVPYYIHRGLETLRDMVTIRPKELAEWLVNTSTLPTTSNPGPGDYLTGFRHLAEHVQQIVALTMTSKGSGAYQACRAAVDILKEQTPEVRVEVIDTLQVAMAQGWAAIEAARAALAGLAFEDVIARGREVAAKGMMVQTADTLRYLYMGGRIGRAQHLVGSLLNIRPVIGMDSGVIVALGTARSRLKAYRRMVELMSQELGETRRIKAAFTHFEALDGVQALKHLVMNRFDCVETVVTELSPALGVHSGPGTVGICFYRL